MSTWTAVLVVFVTLGQAIPQSPVPVSEPSVSCPSNNSYSTADGSGFTLVCDRTYSVNAPTVVDSPTLYDCIDQCSSQASCMGTIYSAINQICQLSSSMSSTTGVTLGTFSVLRVAAPRAMQNQTEALPNTNFADGILSPWVAEANGNATGFVVAANMAVASLYLAPLVPQASTSQAAVSLRQTLLISTGSVYSVAMNIELISSGDNICFVGMRTETLDIMQYAFFGSSYSGALNATGMNTASDSELAIVYAVCTGTADATIGIANIVWNAWVIPATTTNSSSSTLETNVSSMDSTSSLLGFTLANPESSTITTTTTDTSSASLSSIASSSTSTSSGAVPSDVLLSASAEFVSPTSASITSISTAATSSIPTAGSPSSISIVGTSSSTLTRTSLNSDSTYNTDFGSSPSTPSNTGSSTTSDQVLGQSTSSTSPHLSVQGPSTSIYIIVSTTTSLGATVSGSLQVSNLPLAASSSISGTPVSPSLASSLTNQPISSLIAITSSSIGSVTTSSAILSSTALSSPGSATPILGTLSPTALTSISTGFATSISAAKTSIPISDTSSGSTVALSSSSVTKSFTSSIGISNVLSSSPTSSSLASTTVSSITSPQAPSVSATSTPVTLQSSTNIRSSNALSPSATTSPRSSSTSTTILLSSISGPVSSSTLLATRSTTLSTASSSSTAQPSLVCPQSDGTTYTGRDGSTFLLVCAQLYDTSTIPGLPAFVTVSLAACADFCVSQGTQCQGVTWQADTQQCRMKITMAPATNSTATAPGSGLLRTSGPLKVSTEVLTNGGFDTGMDSWTPVTTGVTGLVVNLLGLGLTWVNSTVSCLVNLSGLTALVSALTGTLNLYIYQTLNVNAGNNWFLAADFVLLQVSSTPQTSCWIYFQTDREILWSYLYNRTSANNQTIYGSGSLAILASQFQARAQCNGTTDVNLSFDNLSWKIYPRTIGTSPMLLQPVSTLLNSAFSTSLTPWTIAASSSANVDISVSSGAALMAFNRITTTASPAQLLQALTTAAQANQDYSLTATVKVTIATGLLGVSTATCALSIDLLNQTTTLWSRSTTASETNSVSVRGTLLNGATALSLNANCVGTKAATVTWDDVYLTLNPSA